MKIYTEVNYKWDDEANKLVEVSSDSYDYNGDVALLESFMSDFVDRTRARRSTSGPQDYESLWGMSQGGSLGSYLSREFGLGGEYTKYLTPFEDKPFEFLEQGLGLQQDKLSSEYGEQLSKVDPTLSQGYAKTGFATTGEITQQGEAQKKSLMDVWERGTKQAQHGYATDVYGEQQRQVERFYDDVGQVVQMKQGQSSGGGKK
tara:strand:- start:936 stop:1544 length:609 start_codon:yes stop_codon:yes gene_type:complete